MEQDEVEKAAEKRYGLKDDRINYIQRACFKAGAEWKGKKQQDEIEALKDKIRHLQECYNYSK